MKEYFNLNERARKAWNNNGTAVTGLPEMVSKTGCQVQGNPVEMQAQLSVAYQVLMYVGTFIGVLLSTAVTHFQSGNTLTFTVGEVVISAVIALVIIPVVYEKLQLNPGAPFIVQFGIFVQNGVFWHVLIDSIGSIL
jgi:hypothetical protein